MQRTWLSYVLNTRSRCGHARLGARRSSHRRVLLRGRAGTGREQELPARLHRVDGPLLRRSAELVRDCGLSRWRPRTSPGCRHADTRSVVSPTDSRPPAHEDVLTELQGAAGPRGRPWTTDTLR